MPTSTMPLGLCLPPPNPPDGGFRKIEERAEPGDPLIHELAPMNQDERIDAAGGDDGCGDHRLAEPGCRCQHAGLAREKRLGGCVLLRGQFAEKGRLDGAAGVAFVAQANADAEIVEQLLQCRVAAARQRDVVGQEFGAGHDAGNVEGRTPHRLRPIELRVLEGREADNPVDQTRRQSGTRNVELVPQNRVDPFGQRTGDRGLRPAPRGRCGPGLLVLLIQWQAQPDDPALPAGFVGDCGGLRWRHAAERRQKRPLIGMRRESVVEEQAVTPLARAALQGQRDEVSDPPVGQRVLARKEPVVGLEADVRVALHRLGQQMGAEAPGERRGHRLGEEHPDMAAIPRTRAFQRRGHALRPAGSKESARIRLPCLLVEIGGEKPAAAFRHHGIDADRVAAAQMSVDRLVSHRKEGLSGTGAAPDPGLAAHARLPLVAADGRIARLSGPGVLPAPGEHVVASAKERPEQRDLPARRRTLGHSPSGLVAVRWGRAPDLDLGKPLLKLRLFGREPCETLANLRSFVFIGVLALQRVLPASRLPPVPGRRDHYNQTEHARVRAAMP